MSLDFCFRKLFILFSHVNTCDRSLIDTLLPIELDQRVTAEGLEMAFEQAWLKYYKIGSKVGKS